MSPGRKRSHIDPERADVTRRLVTIPMPFIHEEDIDNNHREPVFAVQEPGRPRLSGAARVVPVLVLALPTPVQPQPVVAPGGVPAVPVPDLDVDPHEPGVVRDVEPDGAPAPVEVGPDPCPAVVRAVDPDDQAVAAFVQPHRTVAVMMTRRGGGVGSGGPGGGHDGQHPAHIGHGDE